MSDTIIDINDDKATIRDQVDAFLLEVDDQLADRFGEKGVIYDRGAILTDHATSKVLSDLMASRPRGTRITFDQDDTDSTGDGRLTDFAGVGRVRHYDGIPVVPSPVLSNDTEGRIVLVTVESSAAVSLAKTETPAEV